MAVIKVFDSKGVKTVVLMGNVLEQDYDDVDQFGNPIVPASEDEPKDDNPFA